MKRSGFAVLAAVLTGLVGLGSAALAQAPQPAPPAPAPATGQRPPAAAPAQPPRPSAAAPAPTGSGALRRPPSYRACLRTARKKGLRGSVRRAFVTRCRLGREPVIR